MNLEAYTTIHEDAKIQGVALIPRISRNNNLYTKAELQRFDGITVPMNWEHDPDKQIGTATFSYNAELETVYYTGVLTDEGAINVARNKTLFTSIEAEPTGVEEICNHGSPDDCFAMPFGLIPQGLALTETPGVPETTVKVMESYMKECGHHNPLEKGRDYTDFEGMKKLIDQQDKQIAKILGHLELEECECGELKKKNK